MASVSRGKISELVKAFKPRMAEDVPEGSRITVHAAVSRFAVLYEKIRNAIDYRDDHLLRKAAIARILKRQLALESDPNMVALHLVRELIAARYLPNGVLPESLIADAAERVKKLQLVRRERRGSERHAKWVLGIVSAELEELLDDHTEDRVFVNFLFESLGDRITLKENGLGDTERRLQVYIACYRSLIKADDEMIGYKLVRAYHPAWIKPETWMDDPATMADEMVMVEAKVRLQLSHPMGQKFLQSVKPWAISLGVLRTAMREKGDASEALLLNEEELRAVVGRIAERRAQESRGRLRRGTLRAIIYLFFTKMLVALIVEGPFEFLLYKEIHLTPLAINIGFPPVLMLIVGSLIRLPGKNNVKRIQEGVLELLSAEGPKGRQIKLPKVRTGFSKFIFRTMYAGTFLLSFGLVYGGLQLLGFTWVSSLIFLFFLCIVSFFAFRLRLAAREFVAVEKADTLSNIVIDFFSLPILRAGQWLSETVSRMNIFIFFFDFIIEAPFKIFLNVLEEWSAFVKEKKEELQ